jgi:hypothetical protein
MEHLVEEALVGVEEESGSIWIIVPTARTITYRS